RVLPTQNKGRIIKNYLKSTLEKGEKVWYIDEVEGSTVIKKLKRFSKEKQDSIKAELLVVFPIVLSSSPLKYEDIPLYLLEKHQVAFSRDLFTAGGLTSLRIGGKVIDGFPKICEKLFQYA